MLSIALPKGRLGKKVYNLFASMGYECPSMEEENRLLVFENIEKQVRYLMVKPSDVAIYVERGAADMGVVGSDVLHEGENDVYELLDLKFGKCKFAVAAKNDYQEDISIPLRVATKYPNVTKKFYNTKNREIEVIKLNGSIELAPLLELSDVIVDIVETGTTLKDNNLKVIEDIEDVSSRLIVNKSSYQFNKNSINYIIKQLEEKL